MVVVNLASAFFILDRVEFTFRFGLTSGLSPENLNFLIDFPPEFVFIGLINGSRLGFGLGLGVFFVAAVERARFAALSSAAGFGLFRLLLAGFGLALLSIINSAFGKKIQSPPLIEPEMDAVDPRAAKHRKGM